MKSLLLKTVPTILCLVTAVMVNAGIAGSLSDGGDFQLFKNPPPANDLPMVTADGKTVNLSDLKGKVVLLNFWRKDCRYCEMEKGYLKYLLKTINSNDLMVLCVNLWDSPAWVRSYATKNGADLTIVSKPEGTRAVVENVVNGRPLGYFVVNEANEAIYEVKGFPSTYVIDRAGKVVAAHLGLAKWAVPGVRDWVAGLIGHAGASRAETDGFGGWLDSLLTKGPSNKAPF
jgi:peroxiredoxin